MRKKHYEAIANIIRNCYEADVHMLYGKNAHAIKAITILLCDYFEQDNPKFNREKFLTACGIEQEPYCTKGHMDYTSDCKACMDNIPF